MMTTQPQPTTTNSNLTIIAIQANLMTKAMATNNNKEDAHGEGREGSCEGRR
jgi:hypothetical protein